MKRTEIIRKIVDNISIWANEISLYSAANMHDDSIISESIVGKILNLVYGWNLVNLNEEKLNFPGIDLIDVKNKKLIQVTSQKINGEKVKKTFTDKVLEMQEAGYSVMLFSLVVETPTWPKKEHEIILDKDTNTKITFIPKENYFDLSSLIQAISTGVNLSEDNLIEIMTMTLNDSMGNMENSPLILEQIIGSIFNLSDAVVFSDNENKKEFSIIEKIKLNRLESLIGYFQSLAFDSTILDGIYSSYLQAGVSAEKVVFAKIQEIYFSDAEVIKAESPVQKFFLIVSALRQYLEKNKTGYFQKFSPPISDDVANNYVAAIVVDAFNRCKIFEAPLDTIEERINV